MGMFDIVEVEHPLPGEDSPEGHQFQTKAFASTMATYRIDEEGRLWRDEGRYEEVPEEERPFYGRDDLSELLQLAGSQRFVKTGESRIMHTGPVRLVRMEGDEWWEYVAHYDDGKLTDIELTDRETFDRMVP